MLIEQHAAFEHINRGFVVRLDECDDNAISMEQPQGGRQDNALPRPARIDRDEYGLLGQPRMQCVGALHHDDALVISQSVVKHAEAPFDGIYAACAALQKAIDESAGVASDVGASPSLRIDTQRAQRVRKLYAGTRDEFAIFLCRHDMFATVGGASGGAPGPPANEKPRR